MSPSFDLGTPINTALFLFILYSVQRIVYPSSSLAKSSSSSSSTSSSSSSSSTSSASSSSLSTASTPARPTPPTDFKQAYSWMPRAHPPTVLYRIYTPKSLEPYNGLNNGVGGDAAGGAGVKGEGGKGNVVNGEAKDAKEGGRILLAIDGIVFDVTAGRSFYGPNGMYGNFAGRDASRGMAKQSFDVEMLTPVDAPLDTLADLKADEIENMKGWIEHFTNKYIVCGRLVENDAVLS